ncbi:hypothetical protein M8J71_17670 [Pseudarthrobacter sp. R1]|uniref:mandelate racemase/muconate lactonizing enzyme family protein n=1 Tax=Pseudarthrobacter sp. R1 TaxID=2944934 RepID=UPI00210B47FE|nr:enolase C-terminal domain-like protein [Pseudarthrobacter sp. R1]MCQ6272297.1 hypothetical protein [Pseudarthrobacter sp. R1]
MTDRITEAEAWLVRLPMPHELVLGPITYKTRDYAILRLITESGLMGVAVGYTRHTPLIEALEVLVPQIQGLGLDPGEVQRTLQGRFSPGWGSLVRAASLIDIALWDISAKTRHQSLEDFMGTRNGPVPLMAVAGYFLEARGRAAVIEEIERFVAEGYTTIKLIIPGHDLDHDLSLIDAISKILPPEVTVAADFHGAFGSVAEAVQYGEGLSGCGLRFIEDPFPSYESDMVSAFARSAGTPAAAGEDVMTPAAHRALLDGGVRYLRADATATGGYTAAVASIAAAEDAAAWVAPHVWPHIHYPLSHTSTRVAMIETIPRYVGADPIVDLLLEDLPIIDGRWSPPQHEGLYLPLDWSRIEGSASVSRSWVL